MAFTITNFLDDVALYLNLIRLPGETNEDFTSRIKSFSTVKFGTDYLTQIQSVMLQTGLKKTPIIELTSPDPYKINIDGEFIEFRSYYKDAEKYGTLKNYFKVFVSDYNIWKTNLLNLDRDSLNITIDQIVSDQIDGNFLLRNTNVRKINDIISDKRTRLTHSNILPGTFRSSNTLHCNNRVASISDIRRSGDYFLDDEIGYLEMFSTVFDSAFYVEYTTYDKIFMFYKTELSLQSVELFLKYGLSDKFIDLLPKLLYNKCVGE